MRNALLGRALIGLFIVSGFAGLIYQSIWSHYLGLVLGHAAYAQTLVLGIFMGGMALGAWLASRRSTGWRNLILAYGIIELIIGVVGLVFHPLFVGYVDFSQQTVLQPWLDDPQQHTKVLFFREGSLAEGFARMALIGTLVEREQQAQVIINRNREQIELVQARVQQLPPEQRKRVARVVAGAEQLSCPGDDSFQNEMIAAAGGIAPQWAKNGSFVEVDVTNWQAFNPQMIYGCDRNMEEVHKMLTQEGWKEIDAVRNRAITQLPCSIACQVTPHVGAAVESDRGPLLGLGASQP